MINIGMIVYFMKQYHDADNWITAHAYRDAAIWVGVPSGIIVVAITTAACNLMKITAGICSVVVFLSVVSPIALIASIFVALAILFCILADNRKKKEYRFT